MEAEVEILYKQAGEMEDENFNIKVKYENEKSDHTATKQLMDKIKKEK
jgi:hypothetical protein